MAQFSVPRPEYPRPDWQRGTLEGLDWMNLNGPWQFRFDAQRRGEAEGWHQAGDLEWREQIIVPFCWESLAAWGEADAAGNDNYYATRVFLDPLSVTRLNHQSAARHEVGWYRRFIEIPTGGPWTHKRVILTIGAADFFADCWCNGVHLGRHEGGYTPFEFDLTDALGPPETDGRRRGWLVLRVEDPMDNFEQPVGKQWKWYTTISGIWQTVFVEPRSSSFIRVFHVAPDLDQSLIRVRALIGGPESSLALRAEITPPEGDAFSFSIPISGEEITAEWAIPHLFRWTPEQPYLYQVRLRLEREGRPVDAVRTYFGMREIDSSPSTGPDAPAVVRLNGEVCYLRGALYQSYFPDGVYTAGEVETIRNDIVQSKRFGFNLLRVHIKIDDPWLLYYADTLGMMLMADFPNFGEGGDTPLGRRRFETMMREAIDRDFNHPAIVAWCLFNETWGFGGQVELVKAFTYDPVNPAARTLRLTAETTSVQPAAAREKLANQSAHAWVQDMWELAKSLDGTRLIEDMSVCQWEHLDYCLHGETDVNSWHFYIDDYAKARAHIEQVVRSTYIGSSFNYMAGYEHKGQPLINSEYGGVGALDGDRDISWSFKFLTNELRRHGEISAYIFTELHDVEWERNGFLNYDRTVKEFGYDPTVINGADTLPIDFPPALQVRPGETIRIPIFSSHFSPKPYERVILQWRLGGMDSWGRLHTNLLRGAIPISFPFARVGFAHLLEFQAPDSSMLCLVELEACTQEGTVIARNFTHLFISTDYPLAREETPRTLVFRGWPGEAVRSEWSGDHSNADFARASDFCFGMGHGFFEWEFPLNGADLSKARRIRVLCEASSHRIDTPQTDDDIFPTTLEIGLNGLAVYRATLRNHPHDARGVLSYLRGGFGAHGYLAHAFAEGDLLQKVAGQAEGNLRLRCSTPVEALAQGGLTIYGAQSGRYPVSPTVLVEW